jgi:hypothetical protein
MNSYVTRDDVTSAAEQTIFRRRPSGFRHDSATLRGIAPSELLIM